MDFSRGNCHFHTASDTHIRGYFSMQIHYLQHGSFEDPAKILTWASDGGFDVSRSRLLDGDASPSRSSLDWLVVMGGSMGVYDEQLDPWLVKEKQFIENAIKGGVKAWDPPICPVRRACLIASGSLSNEKTLLSELIDFP